MFAKKLHLTGLIRDAPKLSLPGKLVFPRFVSACARDCAYVCSCLIAAVFSQRVH